jgi:hypothetical protein
LSSSPKIFSNISVVSSNIATILSSEDTRKSPKTVTVNYK